MEFTEEELRQKSLPIKTYGPDHPSHPSHPFHSEHLIPTNGYVAERIWYPYVPILESVSERLMKLCRLSRQERCGFITTEWEIVEVKNSHENPNFNFYMDIEDTQKCFDFIFEKREEDILAIWHTHPNGYPWPSPRDIRGWPDLEVVNWRYLLVTENDVTEWRKVMRSQ